jgi:Ca2+-binding RTX toxin-like protein
VIGAKMMDGGRPCFSIRDIEGTLGSEFRGILQGDHGRSILAGVGGTDSLSGLDVRDIPGGGKGNDTLIGGGGDKDTVALIGVSDFTALGQLRVTLRRRDVPIEMNSPGS